MKNTVTTIAILLAVTLNVYSQYLDLDDIPLEICSSDNSITEYIPKTFRWKDWRSEIWVDIKPKPNKITSFRKDRIDVRRKTSPSVSGFAKYSESKMLHSCNCEDEKIAMLSMVDYDDKGKVIFSHEVSNPEYTSVIPGSAGNEILKFTCQKRKEFEEITKLHIGGIYRADSVQCAIKSGVFIIKSFSPPSFDFSLYADNSNKEETILGTATFVFSGTKTKVASYKHSNGCEIIFYFDLPKIIILETGCEHAKSNALCFSGTYKNGNNIKQ